MYPKTATDLHIELTDKCQASCPMCARNYKGGAERPFVGKNEITLDKFKQWFDPVWLSQLTNFYACGNYGDPIIAQECLEIFEYVRSCNPDARLSIHTNGSARSTKWWANLAKVMGEHQEVTFGIDGFPDSHVLYRRGTNWNKIIENAKAYIEAGGNASVDCLIFKHNQYEAEEFKKEMLKIGFSKVNFKSTARFYDMDEFPVEDQEGNFEYNLEPATRPEFAVISFINLEEIKQDTGKWQERVNYTTVVPKCKNRNEIYVDASGNVLPCCWVGSDWIEHPLKEDLTIHALRNTMIKDTKTNFSKIGIFNLDDQNINNVEWPELEKLWEANQRPWVCAKNCHE